MLLDILTTNEIYQLHLATLEVLEDIGVSINEESALKLLDDSGATVDKNLVRIPQHLVKEAIKKTPNRVTLYRRDKKHDLKLQPNRVYFRSGGGASVMIDTDTNERRFVTDGDLIDTIRLIDGLDNLDLLSSSPLMPKDLLTPEADRLRSRHRQMNMLIFQNTEKHFWPRTSDGPTARDGIKMATIIAGSEEELSKKPIISCQSQPVSPLQFDKNQIEVLLEFAKHKLPVTLIPEATAGMTSPMTLAGSLVIINAEIMCGLTIAQLLNPGTSITYGSWSTAADMKTGVAPEGAIERGLLSAAVAQLGRYYGFPTLVGVGGSDSKILDEQAAYEKAMNMMMASLAGANIVAGLGLLEIHLGYSQAQLVIDNEIAGMIRRALNGIRVDDQTLAVEVIKEVGPGGQFLSHKHTSEHLKKELFIPELTNRMPFRGWKKAGSKQIVDTAGEKAKRIIKEHQPTPLDKSILQELEDFVKEVS